MQSKDRIIIMICQNCGRDVPEGAVCSCQAPNGGYQPPPMAQGYPPVQPSGYSPPIMSNAPATEAVAILRKHGSSNLMLIFAILLSVGNLASVFSIFATISGMNIPYSINGFEGQLDPAVRLGTTVGACVGLIPAFVILLGVWLFYIACKNPKTPYISVGGLTLIKVIYIINVVLMSIGCVFVFLISFLGISVPTQIYGDISGMDTSAIPIIVITLLCIFAAIIGLFIVYLVFLFKTINAVKLTAMTGIESTNVSMFIIVMCFITGGLSVLSTFAMGFDILALSSVVSAATSVLIGVILLNYRKEMISLVMRKNAQQCV